MNRLLKMARGSVAPTNRSDGHIGMTNYMTRATRLSTKIGIEKRKTIKMLKMAGESPQTVSFEPESL